MEECMKITLFIVPAIVLIVGLISKIHPAKTINGTVGYRSKKSRSSQENWDKAQALMAKYMLIIGMVELVIAVIAFLMAGNMDKQQFLTVMMIVMAIQVCGLLVMFPLVESKLD